jgi:uncharacterized damage-inducible protein DinB
MATPTTPECWLRGPIADVPPALQPAAHAFQQTLEDVERTAADLTEEQLWMSPGGASSVGFHLLHLAGSTDRLLTYARGEMLNDAQKAAFKAESATQSGDLTGLLSGVRTAIEHAMAQLRATPETTLLEARAVGRAQLPTTVLGLLFHAAEHSQRHAGQVVTTVKIVRGLTS